jgi:hypothetical protein
VLNAKKQKQTNKKPPKTCHIRILYLAKFYFNGGENKIFSDKQKL